MKTKKNKILLIFIGLFIFIAPLIFVSNIQVTYASSLNEINENDVSTVDGLTETLNNMLNAEVRTTDYIYNVDDSADFILATFEKDGYAILYKDTLELMELSYSGNPYMNYKNLKKYYYGPTNYFIKENNAFVNLLTNKKQHLSEPDIIENAAAVRNNFSVASSANKINNGLVDEYVLQGERNSDNNAPGFTKPIEGLTTADGTYIDNYTYFLADPYHGKNNDATCASVATQLLLSYYNYYEDRRIIPNNYLFSNSNENPNYCSDPGSMTNYTLGSTDAYYESIINVLDPDRDGASIAETKAAIISILNNRGLSGVYSITTGGTTGVSLNSSVVRNSITAHNPIMITLRGSLGGTADGKSGHVVIAYGYQNYTYTTGEGTYFGYITHYGWSRQGNFSNGHGIQAWVNSSWCDKYLQLRMNHKHNYDNYIGNGYNEVKCSVCGHRNYAYKINKLSYDEVEITDIDFDITGELTIPQKINGRTVTRIGYGVFLQQDGITAVNMSTGLLSIGKDAFLGCMNMTNVYIPGTVTSIGESAFAFTALKTVTIPQEVTEIENGVFSFCAIESVSIKGDVTSIGDVAFAICPNLTSIILPSSVRSIGTSAFLYCQELQSISIPNYLRNIGLDAFKKCDKLSIYTALASSEVQESQWNSSNRPVICNSVISDNYVISFTKSESNPINATAANGINNPIRSGYTFNGWEDSEGNVYNDIASAPNGTLTAIWSSNSCVAEGTLITLADESQKAVEDLTGDEMLLVWNMLTGRYDVAPILFIDSDPLTENEIIKLTFSDGTEVKVIYEHAFFDMTAGEYVFLRCDAAKYIGHYFNKQGSNGEWSSVQLTDVEIYTERTTAWSPVTYGHLCYYVNGMLSMPGATEGLINIFEVDTVSMKYDEEQFAADIAEYGLFTYEEFNEILPLPEEIFNAFNGQYLKVSIGKGLTDLDTLAKLIVTYQKFFN